MDDRRSADRAPPRRGLREGGRTTGHLRVRDRWPPLARQGARTVAQAEGPRMRIEGKTFIVTGGRSGLGEATAQLLEGEGATVVVADLPETDVTDEAAVRALVASCE